jgi:hypothetical protein
VRYEFEYCEPRAYQHEVFYGQSTHTDVNRIIPGALALVVACSCLFFPESPRWLVLKGRVENARLVFATVLDRPPTSEEVEEQLVLSAQIIDVAGESASLSMLFKYGREKMLYRLLLAVPPSSTPR